MAYTHDFNKLALKFKEPCCFNIQEDHKYRVYINNVYFKVDKNIEVKHHIAIAGFGWTIEDAANDFFRRARTGVLYHIITEQQEEHI